MGKGLSIAGFISSIVGLVLAWFGTFFSIAALPISIVGLVLSVVGGKKLRASGGSTGMATAGMVVGIIAVVLSAILFFTCGICVLVAANSVY